MSSETLTPEQAAILQRILAKAWADEGFKAALLADAPAALVGEGVTLPPGLRLRVVENTDTDVTLILPPRPSTALPDEALEGVAGGGALVQGLQALNALAAVAKTGV